MELPEGGSEIEKIWHIKFENGKSNLILSGHFVRTIFERYFMILSVILYIYISTGIYRYMYIDLVQFYTKILQDLSWTLARTFTSTSLHHYINSSFINPFVCYWSLAHESIITHPFISWSIHPSIIFDKYSSLLYFVI